MAKSNTRNPLDSYCREISQFTLIDAKEEIRLAKVIEGGKRAKNKLLKATLRKENRKLHEMIKSGEEARHKLAQANLRLVIPIAKRYKNIFPSLNLRDLIQEGNLGLIRAVDKFDWRRGCKFSTLATWWIWQSIMEAMRYKGRIVKIPGSIYDKIIPYHRAREALFKKLKREPSAKEISRKMKLEIERVQSIEMVIKREEVSSSFSNWASPHNEPRYSSDSNFIRSTIMKALDQLTDKQKEIILMRFGFREGNMPTLKEVGDKFGITKEWVRQIQNLAIEQLRKNKEIKRLRMA